jgi:hypothetical protein
MNEIVPASSTADAKPIIEIENLSISFFTRRGEIPAVMGLLLLGHAGRGHGHRR